MMIKCNSSLLLLLIGLYMPKSSASEHCLDECLTGMYYSGVTLFVGGFFALQPVSAYDASTIWIRKLSLWSIPVSLAVFAGCSAVMYSCVRDDNSGFSGGR